MGGVNEVARTNWCACLFNGRLFFFFCHLVFYLQSFLTKKTLMRSVRTRFVMFLLVVGLPDVQCSSSLVRPIVSRSHVMSQAS